MEHVINVRTSFVGPDHGLWKHILENPGEVNGWRDTSWSGSTVDAVAASLLAIATNDAAFAVNAMKVRHGAGNIKHLATEQPISKLEVCELLAKHLGVPAPASFIHGVGAYRAMQPTIVLPSLAEALGVAP